jgi:hypothetical protein
MFKKLSLLFVLAALLGTLPLRIMAAPNDSEDLRHRIKHVFVIVLENEGFDVTLTSCPRIFSENPPHPTLFSSLPISATMGTTLLARTASPVALFLPMPSSRNGSR